MAQVKHYADLNEDMIQGQDIFITCFFKKIFFELKVTLLNITAGTQYLVLDRFESWD